jgi:hypothetical protein
MQASQHPGQIPDFIVKMIPDRTSELYTDPNSPYNRILVDLEKDETEIKKDHQSAKNKFVEMLVRTPINLEPPLRNSNSSTHRFYKPINRNTESTPLLTKKIASDFDCCKIIKKVFGF